MVIKTHRKQIVSSLFHDLWLWSTRSWYLNARYIDCHLKGTIMTPSHHCCLKCDLAGESKCQKNANPRFQQELIVQRADVRFTLVSMAFESYTVLTQCGLSRLMLDVYWCVSYRKSHSTLSWETKSLTHDVCFWRIWMTLDQFLASLEMKS